MRSGNGKASKVKTAVLGGLVVANALLVAVLLSRHAPENQARAAAANVGDVLAVPGQLPGFTNGVVFLVDTRGHKLTAITVNSHTAPAKVDAMRPVDLDKLLAPGKK